MDENYRPDNNDYHHYSNPNNGYNQYIEQPHDYQQPYGHPSRVEISGKKPAIIAFIFAMVAFVFLGSAFLLATELAALEAYAESMTNASTYYYVANADIIEMSVAVSAVIAIMAAITSDILVIFAYVGHAKNVRNNVKAKFVLVFAIIATVVANLSLFISFGYLY